MGVDSMNLSIRERREIGIEQDIYDEDTRAELIEDDEISIEEAGFMQGYMEGAE